jgi:hypothetical protein
MVSKVILSRETFPCVLTGVGNAHVLSCDGKIIIFNVVKKYVCYHSMNDSRNHTSSMKVLILRNFKTSLVEFKNSENLISSRKNAQNPTDVLL